MNITKSKGMSDYLAACITRVVVLFFFFYLSDIYLCKVSHAI